MDDEVFKYRKLVVYQKTKQYVKTVYQFVKQFPKNEEFALSIQLRRAAISIPSNIAEGVGRYSIKEQIHFAEISFASLNENVCQFEIALILDYITEKDMQEIEISAYSLMKLLSGWRKRLISNINKL